MLSIIVPAFNEESNIARVIEEIENSVDIKHELIVVNDHSSDRTPAIVKDLSLKYPNVKMFDNLGNRGFAGAIKFGFSQAKGELIVPIMGDLCDELNTLSMMVEKIDEGFDVVCGSRYIKNGARIGGSIIKGFLSFFSGLLLHYLLGIPTRDIVNAFKMYKKEVLENINIEASGFEISMELPLKAYFSGFKITEVPTVWKERERGSSSFKVFKLIPSYLRLFFWAIGMKIAQLTKRRGK